MSDVSEVNEMLYKKDFALFIKLLNMSFQETLDSLNAANLDLKLLEELNGFLENQQPNDETLLKYFELILALSSNTRYYSLIQSEIVFLVLQKYKTQNDDPLLVSAINQILSQYLIFKHISDYLEKQNIHEFINTKLVNYLSNPGPFDSLTMPGYLEVSCIILHWSQNSTEKISFKTISSVCVKVLDSRDESNYAFSSLAFLSNSNVYRLEIFEDKNLERKMLSKILKNIEDAANPEKRANYLKFLAKILSYNDNLNEKSIDIARCWFTKMNSNFPSQMMENLLDHTLADVQLAMLGVFVAIYKYDWFLDTLSNDKKLFDAFTKSKTSYNIEVEDIRKMIIKYILEKSSRSQKYLPREQVVKLNEILRLKPSDFKNLSHSIGTMNS